MPFGQLVVGPPGSGKTTYCRGMQQMLTLLGRKVAVINLDAANDPGGDFVLDIADLVNLEDVQKQLKLGPNGGLLYCMDYLASNTDWLQEKLRELELKEDYQYFIFDCPGQVELFTLHDSLKQVVAALTDKSHYRLAAVHLVDAHLCSDATKFISAAMLSLSTMLHLEMPHINILSKIDMIEQYGRLDFNIDFYTKVPNLAHIVNAMPPSLFSQRFRKLSHGIADVIDDFGLLQFYPLAIEDKEMVQAIVGLVDKAICYIDVDPRADQMSYHHDLQIAAESLTEAAEEDMLSDIQECYVTGQDS